MSGTAVAKRGPIEVVCETIAGDLAPKIRQALPNPDEADRFVRVAVTAVQQNPDLLKGTVNYPSLYNSVIRCAQDGLLPDGREAALTRFGADVAYMPMIGGLRKIAAEFGFSLTAFVVYKHDAFSYELGFEPTLTHTPPPLDQDRGDPIGAYATAVGPDGRRYLDVMSRGEIEHVRGSSRQKSGGPWAQHWGEMARKTVGRRLWKQLPFGATNERVARVLSADDEAFDFAPVPALANLPDVDPGEEVVEGEVVDEQQELT